MTLSAPADADWSEGLLEEQRVAASHLGSHGRLLAGPGTGKTWTLKARVEFLILANKVDPAAVTALTFTRAAAGELRDRVDKALEGKVAGRPHILTLHSFALRTLLRNAKLIDALPQPLRIADDWEERHIVQEDLKTITKTNVDTVQENLAAMSSDWDTLRADENIPKPLRADAKFVGAWQQHRVALGYTLRSELVYQLKRALEQRTDLKLQDELQELIIDEYQDLNACDLAVIHRLASRGASVYAAGDDDQSIYGFRHANPEGIRQFGRSYVPSTDLPLSTCLRCDCAIMDLARFVANLDPARIEKAWDARPDAAVGQVQLLSFGQGSDEAAAIASLARYLIDEHELAPDDILVLIRSDNNGKFSGPLAEQMAAAGVPFYLNVGASSPLDDGPGRVTLSLLRLIVNDVDSLAWRTLLDVRKNGVGDKTVGQLLDEALRTQTTFATVLRDAATREDAPKRLRAEYVELSGIVTELKEKVGDPTAIAAEEEFAEKLSQVESVLADHGIAGSPEIVAYMKEQARLTHAGSLDELLSVLAMAGLTPEQDRSRGAVSMLTMHKAKGLTARAVIIMACEDEYLPGRHQSAEEEADERRLLYVSLTRARQMLFITYAQRRSGPQRHTGRDSGKLRRNLTRYLRNVPVHAVDGAEFVGRLGQSD